MDDAIRAVRPGPSGHVAVLARQALAPMARDAGRRRRGRSPMRVILYLVGMIAVLFCLQTMLLLAYREPLRWTFGVRPGQPRSLRIALKTALQVTLIGGILLYPYLQGTTPVAYYGALLPRHRALEFLYGEVIALGLLAVVFSMELATGGIRWRVRYPVDKTLARSARSALSSLTVVAIEEP